MTTSNSTNTTSLFTNAAAAGYLPIRGLKGVCARIKCLADGCSEQAFIFRNAEGKFVNACTCGWKRWAPAPKKWGKPVSKVSHINEELEISFAAKKAAAMERMAQEQKDRRANSDRMMKAMAEFKPNMS